MAPNAPDELKAYGLVWLLHLVGDVHQPLHAASRFTQADDPKEGDRGGNAVKICTPSCGGELHAYWDDILGTSRNVSGAITAAGKLPTPDTTLASKSDEATWVQESFQAAEKSVYVEPIGVGDGPFTMTAPYKTKAKRLAAQRVALAGARLANLLNDELK
jgi:hypothetical protein